MKTYLVIEMEDIELIGVKVFTDRQAAETCFESVMEENRVIEVDELQHEVEGTIRLCGDDSYSAQLIERDAA